MGTAIVATDANRENAGNARIIPPVTRGLQSWLILNDDLTKLQHNFLDGTTGASVVTGAPVVSETSTRFTGQANYLTLPFQDIGGESTIIAVAKLPAAFAATATVIGDYASSSSPALGLTYQAAGIIRLTASRSDGAGGSTFSQTQITGQPMDSWALLVALTPSAAGSQSLRNLTTGADGTTAVTAARVANGTRSLRVGGAYNSAYTGEIDIAAVVYHNVVLSEAEINKQAAFIRRYLSSRNISA